jgi:flavodoxin
MKQVHIYYKVDPGSVEEIAGLIRGVYGELDETKPQGYASETLQLSTGNEFIQIASLEDETQDWPATQLEAFKPFEAALGEHCIEPPAVMPAASIARYIS